MNSAAGLAGAWVSCERNGGIPGFLGVGVCALRCDEPSILSRKREKVRIAFPGQVFVSLKERNAQIALQGQSSVSLNDETG